MFNTQLSIKSIGQCIFGIILLLSVKGFAQETIITEVNPADLQRYIQLAKDNVIQRKILAAKSESAKTAVGSANMSYFDVLSAAYFYRPDNRTAIDPINPYNVNGAQLGISVNIGSFLQKPYAVKKAKAEYKVAQLEEQDYQRQLEMEVKRRYYDYIQQIAQLKINTLAAQDSKGIAESSRYKFEKGEITLDAYNQSRVLRTEALTNKIQSETAFLKAKDLLEELIGQKITDVK